MIDDEDLNDLSEQDSDAGLPENIIDDSPDESAGGDGDNRGIIEKAKDKYTEVKDKVEDVKDKIEKGKEFVEKTKQAREAKKTADTSKKAKDTIDNTKKAADTAKKLGDARKIGDATTKIADTAKTAANAAKTTAKTTKRTKDAVQTAKNTINTVKAIGKSVSTAVKGIASAISKLPAFIAATWEVWVVVLVIILVIVVILVICGAITMFFYWKTDPANMTNNSYITSEHFYGIRSVYVNEDDLAAEMELNYKQFSIELIENIKLDNPELVINIQLPELAEDQNLTNDINLDVTLNYMAKAIASVPVTGSDAFSETDFIDLYQLTDYFGLSETDLDKVKTFFADHFVRNNIISSDYVDINSIIEDAFIVDTEGEHDLSYITNICEKVMIKDEIAGEDGLSDIRQRNYIASIYMPNHDISIIQATYTINGIKDTFTKHFQAIEENGSDKKIHAEETLSGEVNFVTASNLANIQINKFTSINEQNIAEFSEGISLFEALKRTPHGSQYFQQTERTINGEALNIYTWKPTCSSIFYLTFGNNPNDPTQEMSTNKFIFTEVNFRVFAQ